MWSQNIFLDTKICNKVMQAQVALDANAIWMVIDLANPTVVSI